MRHVLVVRLDSMGDMLAAGPAIRAVAARADRVSVLAGPEGAAAARLLPGVDDVLVWRCPWILSPAPAVDADDLRDLTARLADARIDEAVILTSFHQSALPTALLLRLAGVPHIAAVSQDYPGALLDIRLPPPGDAPEPLRMLEIVAGAGFSPAAGDDGRLAVRRPLPSPAALAALAAPITSTSFSGATTDAGPRPGYLVVHPGTSAPARAYPAPLWQAAVTALRAQGWPVVVTGSKAEKELTAEVSAQPAGNATAVAAPVLDLGGRLELAELAAVLDGAAVVVVANTGPAHLAAAVGTPVVSLFSPVVPAIRWAPHGVPLVLLGDQDAPCRDTRSRLCPVAGHPCLSLVGSADIVAAVQSLAPRSAGAPRIDALAGAGMGGTR